MLVVGGEGSPRYAGITTANHTHKAASHEEAALPTSCSSWDAPVRLHTVVKPHARPQPTPTPPPAIEFSGDHDAAAHPRADRAAARAVGGPAEHHGPPAHG